MISWNTTMMLGVETEYCHNWKTHNQCADWLPTEPHGMHILMWTYYRV